MSRALVANILSSFADKAFSTITMLAATIILVRVLPRSDYGIVGVVIGYSVFVQIISLPLENAILRNHKIYQKSIDIYLYNFVAFNLIKGVVLIFIGVVLSLFLPSMYNDDGFKWAILSMVVVITGDSIISPFILYASTQYKQWLVTLINMLRYSLNLLLLTGLFLLPVSIPMLSYILMKDIIVFLIIIIVWLLSAKKYLNVDFSKLNYIKEFDPRFIWETFTSYSLWVHLTGVVTNFIYRADTLLLSFFVSLSSVGNYTISLNAANFVNIAPAILGYQNSVAISHSKDKSEALKITNTFLRVSVYLGIFTLVGYFFLGKVLLSIISGDQDLTDMYLYMICIAIGLVIVKTFASPFVAYINIQGDVKMLFKNVNTPTFIFTAITYYISAKLYGPIGVALSNIIVAIFWITLLVIEMRKYGYIFPKINDYVRDIQYVYGKILNIKLRKIPAQ